MTRLKEQKLWDAMRENFAAAAKTSGPAMRVRLERIENLAGEGTPDVLVLCDGAVTFCELKAVDTFPKRPSTRVLGTEGLRQEQKNWHMGWQHAGGRSLILIGIGSGRERAHFAIEGRHCDTVNEMSWSDLSRHHVAQGVGAAFWVQLMKYLKGNK